MTLPARGPREADDRRRAYRRGLSAETIVAWALRLRGFTVIARRYRTPLGEIDLVARRRKLVVFVEVKARPAADDALEAITPAARRRIVAAAELFVARHPGLAGHDRRFDVALVGAGLFPRLLPDAFRADP